MGFVTDVLTPLIKTTFLAGFIGAWIVAGVYLFFKYILTKKRRYWIKYNVFKRPYDEDIVAWCLDAYDKGYDSEIEIKKILLLKGEFSEKKIAEILYIFSEIKKLKGGLESDGTIRQSSRKVELSKIKKRITS